MTAPKIIKFLLGTPVSVFTLENKSFDSLKDIAHKNEPKRIWLGKFSLNQLDGCCGICVLFNMMINPEYRSQKLGQYLMNVQKSIAVEKDFSIMICTDVINNEPQKAILKKHGYIPQFKFINRKTKNCVELQKVDLTEKIEWKKDLIFQRFQKLKLQAKKFLSNTIN